VLRCLAKRSEDRTDDDLKLIQQATADVKFFEHISFQQHYELCSHGTKSKPSIRASARCKKTVQLWLGKIILVVAQLAPGAMLLNFSTQIAKF
jgi:hypothetical protein